MNRRGFITGLICAPAIVKAAHIMPVKPYIAEPDYWVRGSVNELIMMDNQLAKVINQHLGMNIEIVRSDGLVYICRE